MRATTWTCGRCGRTGEALLAAHLPHPECLKPTVGHPVLWCPVGWGENRTLLKVDAAAGRVSRVADALPKWGSAAMIAPSKLAVVSYNQLWRALIGSASSTSEARRGTWLMLPPAGHSTADSSKEGGPRSRAEPVQGGLATIVVSGRGARTTTLTVYAVP